MDIYDAIIIGGGQSGLAVGYYLRRTGLRFIILDKESSPGGSWQNYWHSLRLFSPAQWSSLPGTLMQGGPDYYPSRDETIDYLQAYEKKYKLPVERPVSVEKVEKEADGLFLLTTSRGLRKARAVISATGSFQNPYRPTLPRMEHFKGQVVHSADYRSPKDFTGKKVAVVGAGNSGAQILAELSKVADTYWITSKKPCFLPDDVDGRVLFDAATQLYKAKQEGRGFTPPSLGDIVMVPPVKEARERQALGWYPQAAQFKPDGLMLSNGKEIALDGVIFCTGFRPALEHLQPLGIIEDGTVKTKHTKAEKEEGLWLVGYGSWTGFASATLIGVGRSARQTSQEVEAYLSHSSPEG